MARPQIQRLARFVTLCFLLGNLALLPPPVAAQPAPGSSPASLQPNQPVPPGFQAVLTLLGPGKTLDEFCNTVHCHWWTFTPGTRQLATLGIPALTFDNAVAAGVPWNFGMVFGGLLGQQRDPATALVLEPYREGVIVDQFSFAFCCWDESTGPVPFSWPYPSPTDPSVYLGVRYVLYFEKGRVEMTQQHPMPSNVSSGEGFFPDDPLWRAVPELTQRDPAHLFYRSRWLEHPWALTAGQLARELLTGQLQVGDTTVIPREPAAIPVAGDADGGGVTYAALGKLMAQPPDTTTPFVIQTSDAEGRRGVAPELARYQVSLVDVGAPTGHAVASVFWEFFLHFSGTQTDVIFVRTTNSNYGRADNFMLSLTQGGSLPWLWLVGWPLTEPYWTRAKVAGVERWVLVQCFERRCLTYTPENPLEWRVEFANTGRHYVAWRYGAARAQGEWVFPWWQVYQPAN